MFAAGNPQEQLPRFLSVGRFVDKKAPHLTLLAFKQVAAELPAATLTMIGDGDLLESCKLLAKSLNLLDRRSLLANNPIKNWYDLCSKREPSFSIR